MHRYLLNLMSFIAGSFHFLTQFIRFHGLLFLDIISWIFLLKKILLAVLLNLLQSDLNPEIWYTDKSLLHSSFCHALECFIILTCFEHLIQSSSVIDANSYIILSSNSWSRMLVMLICPTLILSSLTNSIPLLFLIIICLLSWINSFLMMILIDKGV